MWSSSSSLLLNLPNVIWYLAVESVMVDKPATGTELHVWKKKWAFYPTKLKLCTIIELLILNNLIVYFCLILTGKWRENDVTVLKANLHFPFGAQKVHDSEKLIVIERKDYCKTSIRIKDTKLGRWNFPPFCYYF